MRHTTCLVQQVKASTTRLTRGQCYKEATKKVLKAHGQLTIALRGRDDGDDYGAGGGGVSEKNSRPTQLMLHFKFNFLVALFCIFILFIFTFLFPFFLRFSPAVACKSHCSVIYNERANVPSAFLCCLRLARSLLHLAAGSSSSAPVSSLFIRPLLRFCAHRLPQLAFFASHNEIVIFSRTCYAYVTFCMLSFSGPFRYRRFYVWPC